MSEYLTEDDGSFTWQEPTAYIEFRGGVLHQKWVVRIVEGNVIASEWEEWREVPFH